MGLIGDLLSIPVKGISATINAVASIGGGKEKDDHKDCMDYSVFKNGVYVSSGSEPDSLWRSGEFRYGNENRKRSDYEKFREFQKFQEYEHGGYKHHNKNYIQTKPSEIPFDWRHGPQSHHPPMFDSRPVYGPAFDNDNLAIKCGGNGDVFIGGDMTGKKVTIRRTY